MFNCLINVVFQFLEGDSNYAIVGLVNSPSNPLPKTVKEAKDGTFFMNNNGKIIVDGVEKSTVLPGFQRGSKVSIFKCTRILKIILIITSVSCKNFH